MQPEPTDNLRAWSHDYQFTSGKWTHTDYDFENPTSSLLKDSTSKVSLTGNSALEFYDFPGDYIDKGLADLVKLRIEEEEASYDTASGRSVCRTFSPGARFTLTKYHDKSEAGGKWVITAVEHHASQGGSYFSSASHSDEIYQNSFCEYLRKLYFDHLAFAQSLASWEFSRQWLWGRLARKYIRTSMVASESSSPGIEGTER